MRRGSATALLVSALIVFAGCGSDDDTQTEPSETSPSVVSTEPTGSVAPVESTAGEPTSTQASEEEPQAGGSLTFLDAAIQQSYDPAKALPFIGNTASDSVLIYDSLVRVYNGEVIPRIAESLTSNDDASVWTIHLREGVTFTDGTPYDADAVLFNWDRMQQPELASICANTFASMEYRAVDDLTIEVTLPRPQGAFPIVVADCGSKVASPTALQEFGDAYGTSPDTTVGAGPFILTEWVDGDHATQVRNPDFWDSPRPYLEEVRVQYAPNDTATVDALVSGTAEMGAVNPGPDAARAEDAGLQLLFELQPGAVGQFFNLNREPTNDVRVRQALVLATDLKELNDKGAEGHLPIMNDTYFPPESPFYDPSLTQETNNLPKAQALIDEYLAEKGIDSIEIELINGKSFDTFNKIQAQMWERLEGVDVRLRDIVGTQRQEIIVSGDYQIIADIHTCQDPECFYRQYHSESSENVEGYGSPELDALIDEARGETDVTKQKELYAQIIENLLTTNPVGVFWYHLARFAAFDPDVVKGVTLYDGTFADLTTVWLAS